MPRIEPGAAEKQECYPLCYAAPWKPDLSSINLTIEKLIKFHLKVKRFCCPSGNLAKRNQEGLSSRLTPPRSKFETNLDCDEWVIGTVAPRNGTNNEI